MNLARFPRRRYTTWRTPLQPLPRLSTSLGGPEIWIKRDDLTGLAGGGNKTRKLEFLVADAMMQGADTLITTGAPQSNHCRLTLAAAAKEGLSCHLLLEERVPGSYRSDAVGNQLLFELMGAASVRVVAAGTDLLATMQAMAEELEADGRKPYLVPGGGSNPLGALGYVACAQETLQQAFEAGISFDHVICASGSGGTHAGLLAGLHGTHAQVPLTGISVRAEQVVQEEKIWRLAQATADLLNVATPVAEETVFVHDDQVGAGYSRPTEAMAAAVRLFASREGILLDPVYTGKAAAGLVAMIDRGELREDARVLFVHTGGSPSLHAYPDQVRAAPA